MKIKICGAPVTKKMILKRLLSKFYLFGVHYVLLLWPKKNAFILFFYNQVFFKYKF